MGYYAQLGGALVAISIVAGAMACGLFAGFLFGLPRNLTSNEQRATSNELRGARGADAAIGLHLADVAVVRQASICLHVPGELHSAICGSTVNVQAAVHEDKRSRKHVGYERVPQSSPAGCALSHKRAVDAMFAEL